MKNSFADIIPLGVVSTIFGVTSIMYAIGKPFVSLFLGLLGILVGFLSLRIPEQEKLDKWSAWLGMLFSISSVIWSLVTIYGQ